MTTPDPGQHDLVLRVAAEIDAAFVRGYEDGKADERERAFVLVWRDERGQEICRSSPLPPAPAVSASPLTLSTPT